MKKIATAAATALLAAAGMGLAAPAQALTEEESTFITVLENNNKAKYRVVTFTGTRSDWLKIGHEVCNTLGQGSVNQPLRPRFVVEDYLRAAYPGFDAEGARRFVEHADIYLCP